MAAERELTFKFTAEGIDSLLQRLQQIEAQLAQINQQASPSSSGVQPAPTPSTPAGGVPSPPHAGSSLSVAQQATRNATPAPFTFAGFTATPSGGGWQVTTPQGTTVQLGSWQELRQFASYFGADLPARPQPGMGLSTQPTFDPGQVSSIGLQRYYEEFRQGRTTLDFLSWQQQQYRQWVQMGYPTGSFADFLQFGLQRQMPTWLSLLAQYGGTAATLGATFSLAQIGAQYGGLGLVGAEMHWQSALAQSIPSLSILAGAGIGSLVAPGIGTAVGGGLGWLVGLLARPLVEPMLLRGQQLDVLEDIRRLTGLRLGYPLSDYRSPAVVDVASTAALAGMPLGRDIAERIMMLPAPLRQHYGQAVMRYATDPVLFGLYGYDVLRSGADVLGIGAAMAAGDYTSPMITMTPGGWGMAIAREHARARAQTMLLQPQMQVAGLAFETALTFGGTPAAQAALPGYQHVLQSMINALQQQRAVSMHPLEQAQLDAQIYQLQLQMQMQIPATVAGVRLGEIQAFGAERTGLAQIALQAGQLGGLTAQQLPFAELSAAMRDLANELRRFLRENAQFLPPAQQASLRAQIAQLEFQAGPALQAQQTGLILAQTGAEYGRTVAEFGAGTVAMQLLGAPTARLGVAGGQTQLLLQRAAQLRQQANLPGLDYAARQNLLASAAQLEMQAQQVGIQAGLGFVGEMGGVATTQWQMQAMAAQLGLLRGIGGAEAMPLLQQMMGAAAGQVGVAQWQLQSLAAMGVDPMNPAFVQAQRNLLAAQIGLEQTRLQTAVVPMSAQMREQFSTIGTALGVARTTFAGYADIRGLLAAQMQLIQRRIAEIQAMPPAETPAVQAARTEEINRLVMQAEATQMQLEEGWLDRLVSMTWNAPGGFNLVASGFTRREASLFYGVLTRAFGGSAEMSEYWRRQVPAFYTSLIGRLGTPTGFMETAMTPRIEGNLNVRIIVEQPGRDPITRVEKVNLRDSNPLDYTLTPIMVRGGGSRQ